MNLGTENCTIVSYFFGQLALHVSSKECDKDNRIRYVTPLKNAQIIFIFVKTLSETVIT